MTRRWLVLLAALPSCSEPIPDPAPHDEWDDRLADRAVDYSAALRIAALRLTGELPTLAELTQVAGAADGAARKAAYEAQIDRYLAGPRFARQMFRFWQDTLKLGDDPVRDTAPAFVTRLIVEDRPFLDALTATAGTCTSFVPDTGQFVPADCTNTPVTVGLLTHPGMSAALFSNFGFRRVRWVQETFACSAFPAEIATTATDVGGSEPYTGTFPFLSIAGTASGGRVDFRSTSSVICANCHANLNHLAPLFAHYDQAGAYRDAIAVPTPLPDAPPAVLRDYLPPGEPLAWRHGTPVADMTALGTAMAADPQISACVIARLWNWALGKLDIVDSSARVPAATIAQQVAAFEAGGHRLRGALRDIFTSDDFVRF
ncbi:MAG: DUF1549 domain-containing protein [Deltaproteobacteria bacterium]|nr:MAG: DUF1549 domain-containing protein [Deltaproteobacteria bacterium]TMQ13786.1 MAG: DUF1549 domain-containing protein [Deltaproteobacteria bacterium]